MAFEGIKGSISNLAAQAQKKLEEVVKPPTPSAPPPPAAKPKEEFTDPKAKLMSITGKATKYVPADAPKPELTASVAQLRSMANAGMFVNSVQGGMCTDPSMDLKSAVADGSDTRIRELINKDPSLAKTLTPREKGVALEALRSGVCSDADEQAMVHIIKSCETKQEVRYMLDAAAGNHSHDSVYKFDKELTDHHPYLIADMLNPANTSVPEDYSPNSIKGTSWVNDPSAYPSTDMSQTVSLAKGDDAARKAFISGLTQVDSTRKTDPAQTNGCAPLCIVASTLQSDDPKGNMVKLCDYTLKNMSNRQGSGKLEAQQKALTELKARIEKGEPISKGDVALLQECTYNALQTREKTVAPDSNANATIHIKAVEPFLNDAGIGTSGGVPKLIDADKFPINKDGGMDSDHYVLFRQNGEVFDPWPRTDGKQIIPAGSEEAKHYKREVRE